MEGKGTVAERADWLWWVYVFTDKGILYNLIVPKHRYNYIQSNPRDSKWIQISLLEIL